MHRLQVQNLSVRFGGSDSLPMNLPFGVMSPKTSQWNSTRPASLLFCSSPKRLGGFFVISQSVQSLLKYPKKIWEKIYKQVISHCTTPGRVADGANYAFNLGVTLIKPIQTWELQECVMKRFPLQVIKIIYKPGYLSIFDPSFLNSSQISMGKPFECLGNPGWFVGTMVVEGGISAYSKTCCSNLVQEDMYQQRMTRRNIKMQLIRNSEIQSVDFWWTAIYLYVWM